MKTLFEILLCLLLPVLVTGSNQSVRQSPQSFTTTIQKKVKVSYLLYLPPWYEEGQRKFPLLLFLHGAGERGENLELVTVHGPPKIISQGGDFPFVVISPQCPKDQWWDLDELVALLDQVMDRHRIDEDRVYVTGLSMGGYGAWKLAYSYPERFAAVVPICGGGDPQEAYAMRDVATWVFHGAKDEVVPLERSQEMVAAVKAAGGNIRFTVYPDAGHVETWEQAYDDPELWKWLAKQRRK